jgi:hypothetical protein
MKEWVCERTSQAVMKINCKKFTEEKLMKTTSLLPHASICGKFSWVTYLKAYLVGLGDLIAMTFTCSPTSKTVATLGTRARAILLMCTNPLPYHTERKKHFEISCRRIASL